MFKVKTKYNMTSFWCFYSWLWPEPVYQYSVSTFNFEQAFVSMVWKASDNVLKTQKVTYLLRTKSARPILFSDLSLHWIEINHEQMTILWMYCKAIGSLFMVREGGGREAEWKYRLPWMDKKAKKDNKYDKKHKKKLAKTRYSSSQKRNSVQI